MTPPPVRPATADYFFFAGFFAAVFFLAAGFLAAVAFFAGLRAAALAKVLLLSE